PVHHLRLVRRRPALHRRADAARGSGRRAGACRGDHRVTLLARAAAGVPVDPDAATGRRWATEELLDPIYHEQRSLLRRLLDWIGEQLAGLQTPAALSPVAV